MSSESIPTCLSQVQVDSMKMPFSDSSFGNRYMQSRIPTMLQMRLMRQCLEALKLASFEVLEVPLVHSFYCFPELAETDLCIVLRLILHYEDSVPEILQYRVSTSNSCSTSLSAPFIPLVLIGILGVDQTCNFVEVLEVPLVHSFYCFPELAETDLCIVLRLILHYEDSVPEILQYRVSTSNSCSTSLSAPFIPLVLIGILGVDQTCNFVEADFMKMPFLDNSFDAVYEIEATYHALDAETKLHINVFLLGLKGSIIFIPCRTKGHLPHSQV
ncbi:unnamed protein product [Ilex paraguariensis]|uniref:Methyltransferase type 11 domain-containing protein n=1 Tax=Ilex paraguariensis TaxID=185542 RepID=A0ABC8SPF1_9AQUA